MIITWTQGNELRTIEFDATLRELHTSTSTVPEHPVEGSVNVSDDAIPDLRRITFDVFVTQTPIRGGTNRGVEIDTPSIQFTKYSSKGQAHETETRTVKTSANVQGFDQTFDRLTDVWAQLEKLRQAKQIVSVQSKIATLDRALIASCSAPIGPEDSCVFTVDFQEQSIVGTVTIEAPRPVEPRGNASRDRGGQPAEETSEGAEEVAESETFFREGFRNLTGNNLVD